MSDSSRKQSPPKFPEHGISPLDVDTGILRRDRILVLNAPTTQFVLGYGKRETLRRHIIQAEAFLKEFNPDQPRDDHGRWTSGGAAPPAFAGAGSNVAVAAEITTIGDISETALAADAAGGFLADVAPVALVALGEFLLPVVLVGAVVILGYLAIRKLQEMSNSGTVQNRQDISYEYDPKDRYITLSTSDGSPIFAGYVDDDGFIRDPDGIKVGRDLNGSIIIDDDILPAIDQASAAGTGAVPQAQARATETTRDPEICPDPVNDWGGGRSARSLEYQKYINEFVNPANPLTPGLAVRLIDPTTGRPVYYDDCYRDIGDMVEAKGPGYGEMYRKGNAKLTAGLDAYLMAQAQRQVNAAGGPYSGRGLQWDFEDEDVADRARAMFSSRWGDRIDVEHVPLPWDYPPKPKRIRKDEQSIVFAEI